MKYFLDTEFLEGKQKKTFLGFKYGETPPTIDLISIGIVSEEGREYYALSKDFNLKEAWNRYDIVEAPTEDGVYTQCKIYWIRENVLLPIYKEYVHGDMRNHNPFSYSVMKGILKGFGKSNKQIAQDIERFVSTYTVDIVKDVGDPVGTFVDYTRDPGKPEFYAYYADYDWVVFCQLFGRMIDLPKGFPMYCRDLKQMLDEKAPEGRYDCKDLGTIDIKNHFLYPQQEDEHNALSDAKWDKKLYEFIQSI